MKIKFFKELKKALRFADSLKDISQKFDRKISIEGNKIRGWTVKLLAAGQK